MQLLLMSQEAVSQIQGAEVQWNPSGNFMGFSSYLVYPDSQEEQGQAMQAFFPCRRGSNDSQKIRNIL